MNESDKNLQNKYCYFLSSAASSEKGLTEVLSVTVGLNFIHEHLN